MALECFLGRVPHLTLLDASGFARVETFRAPLRAVWGAISHGRDACVIHDWSGSPLKRLGDPRGWLSCDVGAIPGQVSHAAGTECARRAFAYNQMLDIRGGGRCAQGGACGTGPTGHAVPYMRQGSRGAARET